MYCPGCEGGYNEGGQACFACREHLMEGVGATGAGGNGKLVHFMTCLGRQEAESGRNLLENSGIGAVVSFDENGGVRLWIHSEDASTAIDIFQKRAAAEKRPVSPAR